MVHYSPSLNATFAALADPTRRAILARLSERECAVGELAEPFDMSLPAVLKHLRVLERAGLVRRQKISRVVRCRLQADPMEEAARWLDRYQRFWNSKLDALGRYLADQQHGHAHDHDQEGSSWPASSTSNRSRSASPATTRSRARGSSRRGPTRKH